MPYVHRTKGPIEPLNQYSDYWYVRTNDGNEFCCAPEEIQFINEMASQTVAPTGVGRVMSSAPVQFNSLTATALDRAIPGIGRYYAKLLVDRRPPTGYRNWEHVQEICHDFERLNWSEIVNKPVEFNEIEPEE